MQRAEQHRLRVAVKARASGVSQCFESEEESLEENSMETKFRVY